MNDHVDKEGRVCEVFSDTLSTWLGSLQEISLNIVSDTHSTLLGILPSGNEPEYCFSFMEHASCLKLLGIWTTMKARYLLFFSVELFERWVPRKLTGRWKSTAFQSTLPGFHCCQVSSVTLSPIVWESQHLSALQKKAPQTPCVTIQEVSTSWTKEKLHLSWLVRALCARIDEEFLRGKLMNMYA